MTFHPSFAEFSPVLMPRLHQSESGLRRPALLVAAARKGQAGWRRARDLKRALKREDLPPPAVALRLLYQDEAHLNEARIAGAAEYDLQRHVLLVIAILAERAALKAAPPTLFSVPGTATPERP